MPLYQFFNWLAMVSLVLTGSSSVGISKNEFDIFPVLDVWLKLCEHFFIGSLQIHFRLSTEQNKTKNPFHKFSIKTSFSKKKLKEIERKREGARFKTEREQCDQMGRLCVQFWPFKAM